MTTVADNEKAVTMAEYIERVFVIQGKKIRATFPCDKDENTMTLVKDMLLDSYIKKAGNT